MRAKKKAIKRERGQGEGRAEEEVLEGEGENYDDCMEFYLHAPYTPLWKDVSSANKV
jgi:hypothetical protein